MDEAAEEVEPVYAGLSESRNMGPNASCDMPPVMLTGCVILARQVTSLSFHLLNLNMRALN